MNLDSKDSSEHIDQISDNIRDLLRINKVEEALTLSNNLMCNFPNNQRVIINHSMVNLAASRYNEAIEAAIKFHQNNKESIIPFNLIARALILSEDFREALKYAYRSHEINSIEGESQLLIGISLSRLKLHLDAEVWLSKSINSGTLTDLQMAEAKFYLSQELLALEFSEEVVLDTINKSIEIDPENAIYLMGLGNILVSFGRTEEAQGAYDKALRHAPLMGSLYWNKSRSLKFSVSDSKFISCMQDLYVNARMSDTDRVLLGFSLAKAYRDLGAFEQAFDCWETANAVQKKAHNFDISIERLRFAGYYRDFPTTKMTDTSLVNSDDPMPIFIIGMPRSGTTLAEQIIGSHSRVTPLGELEYLARSVVSAQKKFTDLQTHEALIQIRQSYFNEIKRHNLETKIFTDKMPLNFRFLPIIAHAFPEAKIIHCNRDPMAVCFSNFINYFPAEGLIFTCNQSDIVEYYKLYKSYMELMGAAFSERIYELDYMALTENQEKETVSLLAGCELSFEFSCLEFSKNKRAIATASQRQIRRGMYKGSTDEWKKFAPWLGPMIKALNA